MKFCNNSLQTLFNNGKSIVFILFTVASFVTFEGCKKSNDADQNIPYVPVNFTIQLSLPAYTSLNSVGGSVEIPSVGYRGIVVYRISIDNFVAYDMACPYDPTVNGAICHVDSSGIIMVDNNCGSKFSLAGGGSIVNGPATRPLKPYNVQADFTSNTLVVFN